MNQQSITLQIASAIYNTKSAIQERHPGANPELVLKMLDAEIRDIATTTWDDLSHDLETSIEKEKSGWDVIVFFLTSVVYVFKGRGEVSRIIKNAKEIALDPGFTPSSDATLKEVLQSLMKDKVLKT